MNARAVAAAAIGALHAGAVVGLLATTVPAWRPATGERGALGVWLIAPPAEVPDTKPRGQRAYVQYNGLCAWTVQVDDRGRLFDVALSSREFLMSRPEPTDGQFTLMGVLCSTVPEWSEQGWRLRANQRSREPGPSDIIVL